MQVVGLSDYEKEWCLVMVKVDDVVQLAANHKWAGCLGFVYAVSPLGRILVGVPIPERGITQILVQDGQFHVIGKRKVFCV